MQTTELTVIVSIPEQRLDLLAGDKILASYPVSTSRFGLGTEADSKKTPLGKFRIAEKIGANAPLETVFRGRVPLAPDAPPPPTEDLILARILWLDGMEDHNANTRDRFIYIHGTNHEAEIGRPASHGCIRMRSKDIAELFDRVPPGTEVVIAS
jgi:lipoprotein-anchoring transpeptidase ErfK/SrfK